MTEQQQQDAAITETIAAQLRNEIALRRACKQARADRTKARLTEQLASDLAWTQCAAEEIRLRLMVAQNLKQTTKAKNENLEHKTCS